MKSITDYRTGDLVTFQEIHDRVTKTIDQLITEELILELRYQYETLTYYFEDFLEGIYIYKTYYNHDEKTETEKIIISSVENSKLLDRNTLFKIKSLKTIQI